MPSAEIWCPKNFTSGLKRKHLLGFNFRPCCLSWLKTSSNLSQWLSKSLEKIMTSNQIKSLLLSHHRSTSALVSEIITSVLQTVQKTKNTKTTTIYIWTVHIYRLYRRQCAKYTYIYSVHTVYYKDILSYQYTLYTVCTHLHYVHIYT